MPSTWNAPLRDVERRNLYDPGLMLEWATHDSAYCNQTFSCIWPVALHVKLRLLERNQRAPHSLCVEACSVRRGRQRCSARKTASKVPRVGSSYLSRSLFVDIAIFANTGAAPFLPIVFASINLHFVCWTRHGQQPAPTVSQRPRLAS